MSWIEKEENQINDNATKKCIFCPYNLHTNLQDVNFVPFFPFVVRLMFGFSFVPLKYKALCLILQRYTFAIKIAHSDFHWFFFFWISLFCNFVLFWSLFWFELILDVRICALTIRMTNSLFLSSCHLNYFIYFYT